MRILSIIGTRAQFVKAAPVNQPIEIYNRQGRDPQITEILVHTGQHYDDNMSQIFLDQLKIKQPQLSCPL